MDPQFWSTSLWRNRYQDIWSFMCPLCKEARRVPFRPRPGIRQYFQVFLTSVVFTLVFWSFFGWKGIVSFVPLWAIYEISYRWRMRGALYCSKCGFDPYLFMIDEELAKKEVDTYWRKKLAEKGIPYPEKNKGSHQPSSASPQAKPTPEEKPAASEQPPKTAKESRKPTEASQKQKT